MMPFLAAIAPDDAGALLCIVSSCMNITAQETARTTPKLALVLSGGGARGFAQCGVLECGRSIAVQ